MLGSILGGAVYDYMSGMISGRHRGNSVAELSGVYPGSTAKRIMRVFSIALLTLKGTVFANSPAALIVQLIPSFLNETFRIVVILLCYVLATLLPIGKLYPVFGVILIMMAVSVLGGSIFGGYTIPEITLKNLRPEGLPVWPYMFITVASGAISGFHAAQSPMTAKCITSEKQSRAYIFSAGLRVLLSAHNTIRVLKSYRIWDGFLFWQSGTKRAEAPGK